LPNKKQRLDISNEEEYAEESQPSEDDDKSVGK